MGLPSPRLLSAVPCPLHTQLVGHEAGQPLAWLRPMQSLVLHVQTSHGGSGLRSLSSRLLFIGMS